MTKMHQLAARPKRTSMLPINAPGDRFEQEADRAADAAARGESAAGQPLSPRDSSTLQRAVNGRSSVAFAPALVDDVLHNAGQPLDNGTRSMMEDRLGFDFSRVRVHAEAQAAESARAVRARAYTVGSNVVFGERQYAPHTPDGQRLIAHELTHVRQQSAAPRMLQRWNLFDEIAGWFASDNFDTTTLARYLGFLNSKGDIEDHSDSDNKARAIVAAWKKDHGAFFLTPKLKALLIKEMQKGFCGTDDELAILDLLTSASDDELNQLFTKEGLSAKSLNSDLDFAENDKLMAFFGARFEGGFEKLKQGEVRVKSGGVTSGTPAKPDKPRKDYVFIMGEDSARARRTGGFYTEAEKYFRVHYPEAEMITSERTLEGILQYIDRNVSDPIGNLYVVSHGNEDGTLTFGLNDADLVRDPEHPQSIHGDSHLSPMELKEALHPPGGGKSTLTSVDTKIDHKTTIHIRGCDLGQNKEFVNLIDESFGGKGHVIASTHEQVYGHSGVLAEQARTQAKKAIADAEPMPPPVDPAIKDPKAKRAAVAARAQALKDRQASINQKVKDQADEIEQAAELAGTYEEMSGVIMQRPGTTKFTEDEVKAEIERRYQHLSKQQRANFVARVFRGQQAQIETLSAFEDNVPVNTAQALTAFGPILKQNSFVPDRKQDVVISSEKTDGMESKTFRFVDAKGRSLDINVKGIPVDDDVALRLAKENSPNPQNYEWQVSRKQVGARLIISGVAKRVFADLHHQSLRAGANEPFTPQESNPIFYVKSTYEPKSEKKDDKKK